jgi:hypothetical protein
LFVGDGDNDVVKTRLNENEAFGGDFHLPLNNLFC